MKRRGAAMLAALLFLVVASGIITLMFTSTLSEIRHSGDDIAIVQALTLARGGANMGGRVLSGVMQEKLEELTLDTGNTVSKWAFGDSDSLTDEEPTAESVISDLGPLIVQLQAYADGLALCNTNILGNNAAQSVSVTVFVTGTACGRPLPEGVELPAARYISGKVRTYSVPFVLVSEALVGGYERNVVLQGEYQFKVGGEKFSQYALFTDEHVGADESDTEIWFTSNTLFDGPVHTNGHFRFAYEPWFGGAVTSAGCRAPGLGYDEDGNSVCLNDDYNYGAYVYRPSRDFVPEAQLDQTFSNGPDSPEFDDGYAWQASYIGLPKDALEQKDKAQRRGLYFNEALYELELYAGDASGDYVAEGEEAAFQYIKKCTGASASTCTYYRYGPDNDLYESSDGTTWPGTLRVPDFNGLVYAEGEIERFRGPQRELSPNEINEFNEFIDDSYTAPTLAAFATLTVVGNEDIRITGDLTYENPPCTGTPERDGDTITTATCDNLDARNILGVFTPGGDVLIGANNGVADLDAPKNVVIQGSLMAGDGVVTVEDYDEVDVQGKVNLLGGIIEKKYGAFGLFNRDTGEPTQGYGRSFTFDQRMGLGYSPPFFPGTSPSDVQSVFVYSFGQREQVVWD